MWYYKLVMYLGLAFVWISLIVIAFLLGWSMLTDIRKSYISGDRRSLKIKAISYSAAVSAIVAVAVLKFNGTITWQLPWLANLSW